MLIIALIINIIGFCVVAYDKYAAMNKMWRVNENSFVLLSICFGGVGVFLSFFMFHHKLHHRQLLITVGIITAIEVILFTIIYISFGSISDAEVIKNTVTQLLV